MGSFKEDTYQEEVPEGVDKSQEEWDDLSYHAQYYYVKEGRKDGIRREENRRRQEKRDWLREIKSEQGCSECSEDDPRCLDFHHVGEKSENLSSMAGNDASKERMKEEMEKCVVICANCHRKKHRELSE